ncbi:hypothetical protein EDD18DRAFT_1064873 [Armillaria luteobubalina]|uniref:DUF659 domain-containing protein n=1 Tax=Armillaria luteobubalina TaxID=153913 RepID=A0AA39QHX9_9AGAR|nr:hypothetical protein EDD18DRAFT_1064873 [Armillaria luteobubalina]
MKRAHSVNNLSQLAQPIPYYPTTSFLHPGYPSAPVPSPFDTGPLESRPPSSSSSVFTSTSRAPSIAPSDSVSVIGTVHSYSRVDEDSLRHPAPKRARYSSSHHPSVPYQPAPISWTPSDQARFEEHIVCLTASAGFALSWVENPEWVAFCDDFLPAAKVPSRKVITNRLLPTTLEAMCASIRHEAAGKSVTAQCDGWSGQNHHHYLAFMATVDGKVWTVLVDDTSDERKTTENLLHKMIKVIKILENEWGVCVIAFTTDASGES